MSFEFGGGTNNPAAGTSGLFGAKTSASSSTASSAFGTLNPSFGAPANTAATGFGLGSTSTGGFGTTTASAAALRSPPFNFSSSNTTVGGSLFGNTQNKDTGFSYGLGPGTATGTTTFGIGQGIFGAQTQQQLPGGLFSQQQQQYQPSKLDQQVTALSGPTILGDERDAILANWNQLQAYWGTGKGLYNANASVDFALEDPFCRFKTVGYSCIPGSKDEDGLVSLAINKKEADVRSQLKQLVESLHKVLGSVQTLTVNVEGVKALPDEQTEVIIYVVERSPNAISRRFPATTLFRYMERDDIKNQLRQLGVVECIPRTELSSAQLKQLLQNAPAGMDTIVWEQAKAVNPDPEKLISVPMVGFKELLQRMKIQEQMTKQHQTRVDIISNDIGDLQKNQVNTVAKIAQYKKKLMDLSHRVLQVFIKQEIRRKSGCAIDMDEEHLRVQLDTIDSELNAPTKMKGRLNELMAQIRMQNHFRVRGSEERYSVDAEVLREIKQHLKQQQEGLSHLINVIKDDLEDIKLIEHGLNDSGHIPFIP